MSDFLLELRSEEIPARMQEKAREDLARLFAAELAKSGLTATETVTYATPRRLALIANGLPAQTQAVADEIKGPKTSAPEQALEGFLRKTGLTRADLTERDGIFFAVTEKPGRATADVLAEAIPAVIRAFPWPKSMRWGDASASTESLRWVRPLQGIVALLGNAVIPCEIAGVISGNETAGHRFMHRGTVTIGSAETYAADLHAAHVTVDGQTRRRIIAEGAAKAAADAGLELIQDEGLLFENAGLTEWPVPLLGRFDEAFLQVPPEVIQLTARVNQKYFVCRDGQGALANAFVCTANIEASDGGRAIIEGNQKVLAARLADARFFWDQDLKIALDDQAKKLDKIVFHEKLGTVADKVDRVAKLARWLVEEGIVTSAPLPPAGGVGGGFEPSANPAPADTPTRNPSRKREGDDCAHLADMAERAARLAKADLVTGMVGEFPELQGLIGGYYAAAQGEDPQVAAAIRDHYKPVGQGDEVPTAPVTVAVSLADKLDTIFSFFSVGIIPSGSKDPFALRRAALGALSLSESIELPLYRSFAAHYYHWLAGLAKHWADQRSIPLPEFEVAAGDFSAFRAQTHEVLWRHVDESFADQFWQESHARNPDVWSAIVDFFIDRLKVQQREAGVRHDLIDAVFASGGQDNSKRLLARVHALQAFMATADGANLLAGYKRAANILKKEGWETATQSTTRHPGPVPGSTVPHTGRVQEEKWTPEQVRGDGDGAQSPPTQTTLSYTPEPAETALILALDAAAPRAASAIQAEDFEGAMAALATLRAPIDAFFDSVTVNDPAPEKRAARLNLLARMRDAVRSVADFSKIEG